MLDKAAFFLEVVDCNSISRAAKKASISTSTASRWIQELEKQIGANLLLRSTRNIKLTELGEIFYSEVSIAKNRIDKVLIRIDLEESKMVGLIKIASTPYFTQEFLAQIVGEFLSSYPDVTFKIIDTAFPNLKLNSDKFSDVDLSIKALATYQDFIEEDKRLIKRVLLKYPLITVSSPKYVKENGKPSKPSELVNYNCLYTSTLVGGNNWQYELKNEISLTPISKTVEIENSEFIRKAIINGAGIGYLPEPMVRNDIKSGKLISILDQYTKSEFELALYYKYNNKMPIRLKKFKEYLIKRTNEIGSIYE